MKKMILVISIVFSSAFCLAVENSGLSCSMAYSATGVLSVTTDNTFGWLVDGGEMEGSAVSADGDGEWGTSPANYLTATKAKGLWTVEILDAEKNFVGSFSFPAEDGMKVTVPTNAFMANESEDPPKYDKLEVSCYYTVFAG